MSEAQDENVVKLTSTKPVTGEGKPAAEHATTKLGEALKSLQSVASTWTKMLTDVLNPSDTIEKSLRTRDRVVAGGLGALCFHSAIDLYKISYTAQPSLTGYNFNTTILAIGIVLYWTLISSILFGGYDRKADFPHIFKASFLFNVFIYTVGKLGFVINFGFLSSVPVP